MVRENAFAGKIPYEKRLPENRLFVLLPDARSFLSGFWTFASSLDKRIAEEVLR